MEGRKHVSIYFLLGIAIIIFALSWPIIKIGLQYMPPMWFTVGRLILGAFFSFLVILFTREFFWPTKKDLPFIVSIGLFQFGLSLAFMIVGLKYVAAGQAVILVYMMPLWVIPMAMSFGEKVNFWKWTALLFGLLGILVLFSPWNLDWSHHRVILGNMTLVLSAISWAIGVLITRFGKWPARTPLQLLPWQLVIGLIAVLIAGIIFEPHPKIIWNLSLIGALLFNGILATAFGFWVLITITKQLTAATSSITMLSIPALAVIFSSIILHEPVTWPIGLALISILLGLGCLIYSNWRP